MEFVAILVGGAAIGLVMAWLFDFIIKKTALSSTPAICLNILFPFVAYQAAESFSVSGVLAVVVMGLMIARKMHQGDLFTTETYNSASSVWSTIIYLLSAAVFILIGVEFPQALQQIPVDHIVPLIVSSFVIFIIALVIRILFIFEHKYRVGRSGKQYMDWKNALVIGWSGMRGIVSVATAIALPVTLSNGETFSQRNNLIFLTVVVVMLMLVI